jgi:hypothetical protein
VFLSSQSQFALIGISADNFNRANGGLGANWTSYIPNGGFTAPQIASNADSNPTNGSQKWAFYTGNTFGSNQAAQAVVVSYGATGSAIDILTRFSAAGGYACIFSTTAAASGVYKLTGSSVFTALSALVTLTYTAGDVLRCESQGTTTTMFQNGVQVAQVTGDTVYTTGSPGLGLADTTPGTTAADNFVGSVLPVLMDATAQVFAGSISVPTLKTTNLLISSTAPTVSSGFGSGASITANNGTAAFRVGVGTSSGNTGVIGLPTATTGWNCRADDISTQSTTVAYTKQTASTTASATLANFTDVAVAGPWADNDVLSVDCFAY